MQEPGAVSAVQEVYAEATLLQLLKLDVAQLTSRCQKENVSVKGLADKPKMQAALLHALATRSPPPAPRSCFSFSVDPATAAAAAPDRLKNELLLAMQAFFEPRLQLLSQQAADLAAHNAVQDTLVKQLTAQLANTTAQLQATRAEVQDLSKTATAAAQTAAEAADREEADRRAPNLTVSNLVGVSNAGEAQEVGQALLQHLGVQAQPTIKLLRPSYADAARAGVPGTPAGPAGSSKVLLVFLMCRASRR